MEVNDTEIPESTISKEESIVHHQKFEYLDNLTFGQALEAMKRGHKVTRATGFKAGKGYVFLQVIDPINEQTLPWWRKSHFRLVVEQGGNTQYHFSNEELLAEDYELIVDAELDNETPQQNG